MARISLPMENGGAEYEKEFIVLEPGDYDFIVANRPTIEKSKSSDNQITKIELEHRTEDGQTVKVFDNLVHNEKGRWKTYQFLRALGFSKEEIAAGVELEDLYQLPLRAKIKQEIQKEGSNAGEPRNVVKAYLYEKDAE